MYGITEQDLKNLPPTRQNHIPDQMSSTCMKCSRLGEIWDAFQVSEITQKQEEVRGCRADAKNLYQIYFHKTSPTVYLNRMYRLTHWDGLFLDSEIVIQSVSHSCSLLWEVSSKLQRSYVRLSGDSTGKKCFCMWKCRWHVGSSVFQTFAGSRLKTDTVPKKFTEKASSFLLFSVIMLS